MKIIHDISVKQVFLIVVISFISLNLTKSDSVCDLETLKLELLQDLEDNNMLDCLREIEVPHYMIENEEQKNRRLAAQWDTSCSFEADTVWFDNLKKYYGITQLVDSIGDPVRHDFPDQADMCELIRAAVAKNLFEIHNLDMQNLPKTFVDNIKCSGPKGDFYGPQICAATSGSFFNKSAWNVFNKSSVMLFSNKPHFIESDHEQKLNNPWASEHKGPESMNELDLLSKEQLDNAGGNIAQVINNAIKGQPMFASPKSDSSNNGIGDSDINKDSSSQIHHYIKKENTIISADKDFRITDSGVISFSSEGTKILMGVYMASFKLKEYTQMCMKMNLNEMEISESRQCISKFRNSSISGSFAEKYSQSKTQLSVLALSNGDGEINNDGENTNLTFGAITFPDLGIYKHNIGMNILNIPSTGNIFSPLDNFSMSINNASERPGYYMIITNLSFKLPDNSYFGSLIAINGKDLVDTTFIRGKVSSVGINSTTVVELFPGNNSLTLKYMYQGSKNLEITSSNQMKKYYQSMTAFRLPTGTKLSTFKCQGPVNLSANSWVSFNINAKIELSRTTHIMILYHIHIKVSGAPFSARLKVNGNKSYKTTVAHVEDEDTASIQGYLVKKLKAGSYEFDIEFLTNSQDMFDPASEAVDKQTVSIKILEFPN